MFSQQSIAFAWTQGKWRAALVSSCRTVPKWVCLALSLVSFHTLLKHICRSVRAPTGVGIKLASDLYFSLWSLESRWLCFRLSRSHTCWWLEAILDKGMSLSLVHDGWVTWGPVWYREDGWICEGSGIVGLPNSFLYIKSYERRYLVWSYN